MYLLNVVHFGPGECMELYNLGDRPECRRDNLAGLALILYLHEQPGFMFPIMTTPVGISEKVRPGL